MRRHLPVNRYCTAIIGLAIVAVATRLRHLGLHYIEEQPLTFALLAAGLTMGELLPVKVPRRGGDEAVTLSTSFTFALCLAGGLGPALLTQGFASAAQDVAARKPLQRVAFNVAQYALSMVSALIVIRALHAGARIGTSHPFRSADLPAILLGAGTFFLVNTAVVGIAVALHQGVPIGKYFRNDALFVFVTGMVLLCYPSSPRQSWPCSTRAARRFAASTRPITTR
jgi:diguanylate cyclase